MDIKGTDAGSRIKEDLDLCVQAQPADTPRGAEPPEQGSCREILHLVAGGSRSTARRASRAIAAVIMLALAALIAPSASDAAAPFVPTDPIIRAKDIKPGMIGECRTVVSGSRIVSFPVEVLDVIPNIGPPKHLILIRAYGPIIEQTGGIAAGMSGSPVYIGGRLAGAIGYGWEFSGHDIGLATSIEDLINIWDNPERIPSFSPAPKIPDAPASADQAPASDDEAPEGEVLSVKGLGTFRRLAPPLFVGGVSPRTAKRIGEVLGSEVIPFAGGAEGGSKRARYGARLRPGAAIGTSLVWGDVEVSAIGTLSAVAKDGRFVAFAHPFTGVGYSSAAVTDATISRVIPAISNPFKLGRTGDIIGIMTQDRPEGIGGRLSHFAPAASCTIRLDDVDADRKFMKRFQMVQDPFLISELSSLAARGCIEDLWARSGGGSAKVTAKFYGGALLRGWKRTNIFVSDTDVLADVMQEFSVLTSIFALNQFQELRPFGVELDIELTTEPRVVYIEDVIVPEGPFAPGEVISFDITLRQWRKPPVSKTYSLTVPESVSGICELMVRGGGVAEEEAEYTEARWRSISSLPILLRELDARESNDQIVLEIRGQEALDDMIKKAQTGDTKELMNEKLKSEIREEKEREGSMRVITTNNYVDGMVQKLIFVKTDPDDKE